MRNQSTPSGILTSSNIFSEIETEIGASAALSAVLLEPDECASGVPATAVTATQARDLLLDRPTPESLRDAIWTVLVRRASTQPRPWERIAIWVMLPSLRGIANRLHRRWRVDIQDLRSEVVLGFIEALRQADPDQPHLGARLWWNTYRLARQMCRQGMFEQPTTDIDLIAARHATGDRALASPVQPIDPVTIVGGRLDSQAVESERLGSLAARLGLRTVIEDHRSGDGISVDVFVPRPHTGEPSQVTDTRGNGPGEAA